MDSVDKGIFVIKSTAWCYILVIFLIEPIWSYFRVKSAIKNKKEPIRKLIDNYKCMLKSAQEKANYIIIDLNSKEPDNNTNSVVYENKIELDSLMLLYYINKHIEVYRIDKEREYSAKNEDGRPLSVVDCNQVITHIDK